MKEKLRMAKRPGRAKQNGSDANRDVWRKQGRRGRELDRQNAWNHDEVSSSVAMRTAYPLRCQTDPS